MVPPEISSARSTFQSQKPSSGAVVSLRRGCGQWGLLGGSPNPDKASVKTKTSKLATLARSSKGAFDKRQQYHPSSRVASISRLAALNSGSKSESSTPPPKVTQSERSSDSSREDAPTYISDSIDINVLTDPHADHLLAQPSILANSLFQLWVMPRDVANSILRIYANLYLLTVSDKSQLQKAFSSSSPDDIVRNAQLPRKGIYLLLI